MVCCYRGRYQCNRGDLTQRTVEELVAAIHQSLPQNAWSIANLMVKIYIEEFLPLAQMAQRLGTPDPDINNLWRDPRFIAMIIFSYIRVFGYAGYDVIGLFQNNK